MTAEKFKSEVASWIHTQTNDYDIARNQVLRFNDVYDMLREGITHFWFRKGDGSLRSAYGTLDMTIVERHGGVDLEKDAWRCFKANAVQEVDFSYGAN